MDELPLLHHAYACWRSLGSALLHTKALLLVAWLTQRYKNLNINKFKHLDFYKVQQPALLELSVLSG